MWIKLMDAGKGIGAMLALGIALYGFIDLEYYGIQTRGGDHSKFATYSREMALLAPKPKPKAPQPQPQRQYQPQGGGGMDA